MGGVQRRRPGCLCKCSALLAHLDDADEGGAEDEVDRQLDEEVHAGQAEDQVVDEARAGRPGAQNVVEAEQHAQDKESGVDHGADDARGDDARQAALLRQRLVGEAREEARRRALDKADDSPGKVRFSPAFL